MAMSRNTLSRLAVVLAAIAISVAAVACGDDSGESAGHEFCSDLDTVQDDLSALEDIDVSVDKASEIGSAGGTARRRRRLAG